MRRHYLLDTGIAQDYQANRRHVRQRAIRERQLGHRIGICVPVLGELWAGVEFSSSRQRNLLLLQRLAATLVIWPYSTQAAQEYGLIYADLRRSGCLIQQIDMQIGAIARTLPNCVVVTKDSDFSVIPGISVENWAS